MQAERIQAEKILRKQGRYELVEGHLGNTYIIRRRDNDGRARTVAIVAWVSEWERFIDAIVAGFTEVDAVRDLDR